jgi:hypothetical protein
MDVAERAASLMGVKRSREYPRKLGHKSVYAVRVGADAAIALMQQLRPHMGARRGARIDEVLALALARPGYAFGERQGVAKLTADAVREIRSTPIRWGTQTKLARKFGVSQACIWNVVCGRSWTKVA